VDRASSCKPLTTVLAAVLKRRVQYMTRTYAAASVITFSDPSGHMMLVGDHLYFGLLTRYVNFTSTYNDVVS